MAEPVFINEMISRIFNGEIRIPSFQRGFVWDADRVAHLMDSIYKGYPFETLLFWRTKSKLKTERSLGPFELPPPKVDYPIDYVLDGQQRATSIFGVFQNALNPAAGSDADWTNIYFDAGTPASAQDSQFSYLPHAEVDPSRHFPLRLLLDAPKYRKYVTNLEESIAEKIDQLYQKFTTARIPVQSFQTDDRAAVAIVFERINRLGVKLDTLQLLSAWSWSEEFDLQGQFGDLSDEIAAHGFGELGDDTDLLLRCCAAIISHDASPGTIIGLKGDVVRDRFPEIRSGIRGAIDFLITQLHVYSINVLPFTTLLIPLSVFFATNREQDTHPTAEQRKRLLRWIWRTLFTRRYSKRLEQLNADITEVVKLRSGAGDCSLGDFPASIDPGFFYKNQFTVRNVDTKTFILMLASMQPLDFRTGGQIALSQVLRDCNKKEFHHLYPKALMQAKGVQATDYNGLVNFCILSRATNNAFSDSAPSEYRKQMPQQRQEQERILATALCPVEIFDDNFGKFVEIRTRMLMDYANTLMET